MTTGAQKPMADIVSYYNLTELPFELTPNLKFYCLSDNHKDAFDMALFCINKGEALIKITGEVGSGKTMLCRKLLHAVEAQGDVTLYIPNPAQDKSTIIRLIAGELELNITGDMDEYTVTKKMTEKLISHYKKGIKTILIIDEAQSLSDESIEALRLLTNIESEDKKLLQIVLLGQPELDLKLNKKHLRQVLQRIGFSYRIRGITRKELDSYVAKRLISAGHDTGLLFTQKAKNLLYKASKGTPRVINILAYKALLSSYTAGRKFVDKKSVKEAICDSKDVLNTLSKPLDTSLSFIILSFFAICLTAVLLLLH